MTISRRDLLAAGAGLAGAAALPGFTAVPSPGRGHARLQAGAGRKPARAALVALREGRGGSLARQTQEIHRGHGIEVRIDKESWEDIRPKAAVAANVGSGPDIVWVWFDDAQQYPDKLLDVTPLANALGAKYGGCTRPPRFMPE